MVLLPEHLEYLKQRGISDPRIIDSRGYRSITSSDDLIALGFSSGQSAHVPGLLLPIHNIAGQPGGYEYRADTPRERDGKKIKFDRPRGQTPCINVHPMAGAQLRQGSPFAPLILVEGVTRADALLERGVVSGALLGIWGFKGDTGNGTAILSDIHEMPIKGRVVWICPDGDVLTNPGVNAGVRALGDALTRRGARQVAVIVLRNGQGLDDALASGLLVEELPDLAVDVQSLPKLSVPRVDAQSIRNRDETLPRIDEGSLAESWLENDDRAKYVTDLDRWVVYAQGRWTDDPKSARAGGRVHEYLTSVADRYVAASTGSDRKAADETYTLLRSRATRNAVRELATGMRKAHVQDIELDARPQLLNLANGTLNLITRELTEHDPSDMLRGISDTHYLPGVRGTRWEQFVTEVLPDEAVRRYLQRLLGASLLGETSAHVLPVLVGKGRNGKSVMLKALEATLGRDYCGPMDRKLLIENRMEQHSTNLMALKGKRLVFASETESGERFAAASVKTLTGGDMITARGMRQDQQVFRATHSLILVTNSLPEVDGADEAMWARLKMINFTQSFAGREDMTLSDTLATECSGILNWLLDGLDEYLSIGLTQEPDGVSTATDSWRHDGDTVQGFITDLVQLTGDDGDRVLKADMMAAYSRWCSDQGATPEGNKKVTAALRLMAGEVMVKGTRYWSGVRLGVREQQRDGEQQGEQASKINCSPPSEPLTSSNGNLLSSREQKSSKITDINCITSNPSSEKGRPDSVISGFSCSPAPHDQSPRSEAIGSPGHVLPVAAPHTTRIALDPFTHGPEDLVIPGI